MIACDGKVRKHFPDLGAIISTPRLDVYYRVAVLAGFIYAVSVSNAHLLGNIIVISVEVSRTRTVEVGHIWVNLLFKDIE